MPAIQFILHHLIPSKVRPIYRKRLERRNYSEDGDDCQARDADDPARLDDPVAAGDQREPSANDQVVVDSSQDQGAGLDAGRQIEKRVQGDLKG